MDPKTTLPWHQPWNFLFNAGLDEPARKKEMATIGKRLHDYIKTSLGGTENFSLQITWNKSVDNDELYTMFPNLVVKQEGIVAWEKKNEKIIKGKALNNNLGTLAFENPFDPLGGAGISGSKPPPPPPPPPPRAVDILGDAPPFKYFSNQFIRSHVLDFDKKGVITQFGQRVLGASNKTLTQNR